MDAYAGDLITTNPGEVHDGRPLHGASRRWRMIYLEPDVVASMQGHDGRFTASDLALTRPVIRDIGLTAALKRLFAQLDRWGAEPSPDGSGRLACEESLVRVCALLLGRHSSRAPEDETDADISRVRDRLADDWLSPPSLSDLATMVGLSKYQLLRRFEQSFGAPPHAWLLSQRAEHARGLIGKGFTLAQAAVGAGFADQSHMTRRFARQFGFTPGAWRIATGAAARGPQ